MARPCGGLRSASVSKYLNWINMLQSLLDPYYVSPVFHELHGMCLNSPLFRICYTGGMQTVNQVKSSCLLSPMSFAQVLQNKMLTVFHQHKYSTQNWPNVTTVEVRIYEPLYASTMQMSRVSNLSSAINHTEQSSTSWWRHRTNHTKTQIIFRCFAVQFHKFMVNFVEALQWTLI